MNRCARCSGGLSALAVFCPHCGHAHEPDFDRLIGQTIEDRYRIYRRLGSGGLSTVFAATDLCSDQIAAIKVSSPAPLVKRDLSYAINEIEARHYWNELLERMRREAETLASIDHPNIVRFFGTGRINEDLRYVAMEFLRGRTLREELDECGRIEPRETVRRMLEVAAALTEVHARGIVHRDISPRNIFLCDNAIKLIDFGIAKFPQPDGVPPFTRHSLMSGTVAYASPEQCQSRPIDHRSDIYSLAIVVYEMLTGERPFQGRTPTEIALKQIQSPPTSPRALNTSISTSLEQTILRALTKNPDERHQNVMEFAGELRTGSNQIVISLDGAIHPDAENETEATEGLPPSDIETNAKPGRTWRRATLATAASLSSLIAAGMAWDYFFSPNSGPTTLNSMLASASPSSTIINGVQGSDADALELDAKLPPPTAALTPAVNNLLTPQNPEPTPAAPAETSNKPAAQLPTPLINTSVPHPQGPPLPAPTVNISREPKIESHPEISQGPRRNDPSDDDHPTSAQQAEQETEPAPAHNRYGSNEPLNPPSNAPRRTIPPSPRDIEEEEEPYGPKLLQWNGSVYGERE